MFTVVIYMKSGNVIRLPFVADFSITSKGDRITGLTLKRHWLARLPWVPKLFVPSIALEQIEAAVLI